MARVLSGAAGQLSETLENTLNGFTNKLEVAAQNEIEDLVSGLTNKNINNRG